MVSTGGSQESEHALLYGGVEFELVETGDLESAYYAMGESGPVAVGSWSFAAAVLDDLRTANEALETLHRSEHGSPRGDGDLQAPGSTLAELGMALAGRDEADSTAGAGMRPAAVALPLAIVSAAADIVVAILQVEVDETVEDFHFAVCRNEVRLD